MLFKERQTVKGVGKCSMDKIFLIKSAKDGFYVIEDVRTFEVYSAFSREFDPFFEVADIDEADCTCVTEEIDDRQYRPRGLSFRQEQLLIAA